VLFRSRCNWRCVFCYNPRHFDKAGLTGDEWIRVLDELRGLGTLTVSLTGGEPLAHPDFFRIAEAARERAFAVKVFTNGSLVDPAAADRLASLRLLAVEMSLHGATAAVHDRTTGRPGSYAAVWCAVDALRARGVPLLLKAPLTLLNEHEIEGLVAAAAARAVPLRIDPVITPRDDGDATPLQYAPSPDAVRRLMTLLASQGQLPTVSGRADREWNCGLGRMTLAVDPEGGVFPCIQWRKSAMGNVRKTSLRAIWSESPVRAEAVEVSRAANERLRELGGAAARFPYCPALAFQESGDALVPGASFLSNAAAAEEARAR